MRETPQIIQGRNSVLYKFGGVLVILFTIIYFVRCLYAEPHEPDDTNKMIVEWNQYILRAETKSEGYRGPIAARAYGYIGLAAYETARPGFHGKYISMATKYKDLALPAMPSDKLFDAGIALNACYANILSKFFLASPDPIKKERKQLEQKWNLIFTNDASPEVVKASVEYGNAIATAIYNWSATDTMGFNANHHNYDRDYETPLGEGKWVTSIYFPMPALLPYWGKVRPFIIQTDQYIAKPLPEYSTQPNELYNVQALEVLSLSKPLSKENQWIGEFWHDDHPGWTFTPPGHWIAITNQVVEKERPSLEKTVITYLKVGFAMADAMIACWNSKYIYNLERPETYIQKNLDSTWRPHAPSPPFPSYPSGHSMYGAAAAEVLTNMYGVSYKMTDMSHEGIEDFTVKPRHFESFEEMSKENALSRIFLGVHWRIDCEEGLRLGSQIGKEVCSLELEEKLYQ